MESTKPLLFHPPIQELISCFPKIAVFHNVQVLGQLLVDTMETINERQCQISSNRKMQAIANRLRCLHATWQCTNFLTPARAHESFNHVHFENEKRINFNGFCGEF